MISIQGLMDDAVQDGCFFIFLVVPHLSFPSYLALQLFDPRGEQLDNH